MSLRTLFGAGAALLILGAPLAACGKLGELQKPGSLNGADGKAKEQHRQTQEPERPVETVDPRDRASDLAPPRSRPIEGSGEDVTRAGPAGGLPDPFANPR